MEKQKVSTKKRMEISEVTGLLRDFADGLDNGKLTLEHDGDILELSIPVDVEAKISGRRKEGKEKFSLELSWKQDESLSIQINPEDQSKPENKSKPENQINPKNKSNDNAKKEVGGEKGIVKTMLPKALST